MYNPSQQWERFGRDDPYYGVYSVDEFRQGNLDDDARERFFASGAEHVDGVLEQVRRWVRPDFSPSAVLDHGCGVGRLVVPFAERAERVVGVDVSGSMLAEARSNCEQRGLTNVEFVEAARLDTLQPQFDLVHSYIVLQHIPRKTGEQIFTTLASLVRPGGVGVLHVPVGAPGPLAQLHTWVTRAIPFAYNVVNVLRGRPWSYPHMQMNTYRLNTLVMTLVRQGYEVVHAPLSAGHGGYAAVTLIFERPRAS